MESKQYKRKRQSGLEAGLHRQKKCTNVSCARRVPQNVQAVHLHPPRPYLSPPPPIGNSTRDLSSEGACPWGPPNNCLHTRCHIIFPAQNNPTPVLQTRRPTNTGTTARAEGIRQDTPHHGIRIKREPASVKPGRPAQAPPSAPHACGVGFHPLLLELTNFWVQQPACCGRSTRVMGSDNARNSQPGV
jgi:hypothetical protein